MSKMDTGNQVARLALSLAALWASNAAAAPSTATRPASHYADGVYTATGQYGGQPSFITVTVTIDDDVITDVKVTPQAVVPQSLELQRRFAAAVPKVVVGRRLDEVKVDKLAGSSGTPKGFNAALAEIRKQAATL